jgi:Bacteriophage CI repressor helix-turn-helix domain
MLISSKIIDRIIKYKGFKTDAKLSDYWDITPTTVTNWRKRNSIPFERIITFCEAEGISLDYIFTGKGEMIRRDVEGDDPEISELLQEARKVLKSGNKVAQEALESGIRYITQTIDDLENMEETKKRQKNMELRMAALETRLKKSEDIRKEDLPELQEELLKLRTTG